MKFKYTEVTLANIRDGLRLTCNYFLESTIVLYSRILLFLLRYYFVFITPLFSKLLTALITTQVKY